jgi:hypothetical protein
MADLKVYHRLVSKSASEAVDNISFIDALVVDTCQRSLIISKRDQNLSANWECFSGKFAYALLLRIVAGLESRIVGETEIQSQFKEALLHANSKAELKPLQPWLQRVLSDVKSIRSKYLQNIGGSSYGTLARRLLSDTKQKYVLMIGAGQLAAGIIPYLNGATITCFNRNPSRAEKLRESLRSSVDISLADWNATSEPMAKADILIFCTPVNIAFEQRVIDELTRHRRLDCVEIVHFGGRVEELEHWQAFKLFYCLTHIFDVQADQNELKESKVEAARHACQDIADQRYLMDAITINHGWEDLAAFF